MFLELTVQKENEVNKRLDIYLNENIQGLSRSKIKSLIDDNKILLNGKPTKSSNKINLNDNIKIEFEENSKKLKPQKIDLDIIYEDDGVIVINKPRGMVVHPGNGNEDNTLVNALLFKYKDNLSNLNEEHRPGIVHRIDKDTSGLLLIAKNNLVHESLAFQLKNHSIKREYTFICHGLLDREIILQTNIARSNTNRLKFSVSDSGKYAYTTLYPLECFQKYTYGKAILKTGRTHQIRVHLSYINHPIVGDKLYSNYKETISGQLLHAGVIGFINPTNGKYLEFKVDEPEIFKNELNRIRNL